MTEKIIFPNDPTSATFRTIQGWVSRNGKFFGVNEDLARYDGATHIRCETCGDPTNQKFYTKCASCREAVEAERYRKAERMPYKDGPLYSETKDNFFDSLSDLEDYLYDNATTVEALRIYHCYPVYADTLNEDFFHDCLPEEGELPDELADAIDEFNAAIKAYNKPLSWSVSAIALEPEG